MSSLPERDRAVCWHPYTQHQLDPEALPVVAAKDCTLTLADGTQVLDAISSWWANLHGHGREPLVDAMAAQAASLDHIMFAGFTHEPAVRLAEELLEVAPKGLARVFYSDNGSTAVEVGLKAAYQAWVRRGEPARTTFLALEGSYHGDTFGAMAIGEPDPFFAEFEPFLFHAERIPPETHALECALKDLGGRVAGFVLEPLVQGAAGMKMHDVEFLRDARALCDKYGVYLIADEVMTGFGRTGHLFACDAAGISPDILCLAKGLTGGIFPLSATLVREDIYAAFLSDTRGKAFFHGHTFTGNPIGCAIGLASLAMVREEDTPARLDHIGSRIELGLASFAGMPGVKELRRCGGIVAVELESADAGYLAGLGDALRAGCRAQKEVLLRPLGNVLYAMPPSCTTDEEVDRIVAAMEQVLRGVLKPA
ncbi:MAG: adenosylmethionine--8-amino-7-oxononanoate transaminase [Planctomycetota bacterium]|jgi:adenosylmethionine-8-amino-7-oxononanoate aminotransferase